MMPPITSQWPERYFVVECITRSTPSANGCCRNGVAQVLSQALMAPAALAISAIPFKSVTAIVGLDGVSVQTSRVFGLTAACTAARFVMSTNDASSPHGLNGSGSRGGVWE